MRRKMATSLATVYTSSFNCLRSVLLQRDAISQTKRTTNSCAMITKNDTKIGFRKLVFEVFLWRCPRSFFSNFKRSICGRCAHCTRGKEILCSKSNVLIGSFQRLSSGGDVIWLATLLNLVRGRNFL